MKSNIKKRIAALLLGAAMIVGSLVMASPAQAAPWNCPVSGTGKSRSTICYNGSGQYRVAIHCISWVNLGATSRYVYGPWISTSYSRPSVAWCDWSENVGAAWAQTR